MKVSDDALTEFGITHAMTRLAPPGLPDYRSMFNLAQTQQWILTSIEASAAILERVSPTISATERALHSPNWIEQAFRNAESAPSTLREFAREPNFYEKHVYRIRPFADENLRLAMHYSTLIDFHTAQALAAQPRSPEEQQQAYSHLQVAIANSHLAIRRLNLVLDQLSSDARACRLLGSAYSRLSELEQMVGGASLGDRLKRMRYFQAVMAYRQSLVTEPDDEMAWSELLKLYRQQNRNDLAGDAIDHLLPLLEEKYLDSESPEIQAYLSEQQGIRRDYRDMIRDNQKRLDEYFEKQVTPEKEEDRVNQLVELVTEIDKGGFGLAALKLLDDERDSVSQNPVGVVMRGQLMMEAGRLEEAHQALAMIAEPARRQPELMTRAEWQFPTALTQLAISDLTSAYDTWSSQLKELDKVMSMSEPYVGSLLSLPMVADANIIINAPFPVWPMQHLDTLSVGLEIVPAAR
ncbi:MAG: hypothetical protein WKF77_08185 [Planctomycetaceae bacterium]